MNVKFQDARERCFFPSGLAGQPERGELLPAAWIEALLRQGLK